jgi:hypothetical protein
VCIAHDILESADFPFQLLHIILGENHIILEHELVEDLTSCIMLVANTGGFSPANEMRLEVLLESTVVRRSSVVRAKAFRAKGGGATAGGG